ncbi:MAG: response regulator [Deltaproteobacteria bacterium]|nr:response regulator [Deltaproteobacteria bacterium]
MKRDPQIMQVLVVDDEQDIRDGSERILSRMGCRVFKAGRGEEGLDVLSREAVDIVLLDLKMPGMDGMEVLARIQSSDQQILVIVITGFATVETAIEAMKQGAYDFIPKPFEPDQLRIVINRAQDKIRLAREAAELMEERKRTLADLGTEKSRIHTIIESLPSGLVVTNTKGQVVLMNPSFRRHLDLAPGLEPGEPISAYVDNAEFCDLAMKISRGKSMDSSEIRTCEFSLSDKKYVMARGRPVLGEGKECLGAVITLVDISAIKVLDRLKSEFVAKVSHELRSPLSTIHEQLALVIKDMTEDESGQDQYILSRAKEKTQGLISLIGDLLDLSRIEAGNIGQQPRSVPVDKLLSNIVDFINSRARSKQQTLVLNLPSTSLPPVTADPVALESIFGNLITNAINYTQDGGEIRVQAKRAEDRLCVTVSDNGFGIESKHLENIFKRFYRVKNEKTRFITGTGLGLPIVKGLLDELGGSIRVESTVGQGSVFTVFLPLDG